MWTGCWIYTTHITTSDAANVSEQNFAIFVFSARMTERTLVQEMAWCQQKMFPWEITVSKWQWRHNIHEQYINAWLCYTVAVRNVWPLQWRHDERYGISNHQPCDCLLDRLFRRTTKKIPKLRVTGLCATISPVTGEFSAQRTSIPNAENVSI